MSFLDGKLKAGLIPVLVLAVSVGFVAVFDPFGKWTFNPPNLTLILNAIFLTGTGIVVAAISARSYLRQGNFNILLLGSAVLVSGLASLAAGRVLSVQTPNYSVTIHNVGFLASSILQILSAILIFSGTRTIGFTKRKLAFAVSYSVMVLIVISLTVLTLLGLTPTFFVEGGPTLLRQAVVGTTIILFTLSCLVLFRSYLLLKSRVLYWYSLSLGLFAIGFLSLTLQIYAGDGFSWVSKFAQYTGGFYFILAVLSTRTKDSNTGLSENWAEAFRSDRKQIASFFSKLSEGFAYCKIIEDGAEEKERDDFVYLDVNNAFETMMGKTRSEIVGKKNSEVQPQMSTDPEAHNVLQLYAEVALTGESKRFERYSKFADKWFNILVYSPSKGYFALLLEDITERKKAEDELKLSEEKYRQLLLQAPAAIYEIDFSGPRFLSVNDGMSVMSGFSREELLVKNPNDFLVPESLARFKERIAKAFAGEKIDENVEYTTVTKDGRKLCITLNIKFLIKNGKVFGAQVVAHDITARKKAEEALKESEKTFLELIERAPFGIYVINSQFRIAHMNKGSQNGAFINVRPIIGRDFSEAMHILWAEPTASEIISHFRHTLETGEPYYSPQFINPRHDVEIVESYEWELQRIRLPDGQYGVICYYFDSTKLREAERGLSESQAKLKEYSTNLEKLVEERTRQLKDSERLAAIGATAGMVGHDIRNPLQAITSDVYLVKTELASTPESDEKNNALESLQEIEKNIDYINKIVQDLQDYSRPLNPRVEESDLKLIVEGLIAKNGFAENLRVKVNLADGARKIRVDSYYLNRILFNLVTNAVQAMPQGGILTIEAHKETGDTVITVADTGVGIPKNIQEKMFTLMFTTKSKGQGFGLPVVKRMTESLGGAVTFESQEGKGTTFIVRLPQSPQQKA